MRTINDMGSEFADLISQLQQTPENHLLKHAVINKMPQMKALARGNPMALYRLAQVYSESSPQYKSMMQQSADLGCTNAMLSMCQCLVKSNSTQDLKRAVIYYTKIQASNDSYIKELSHELLEHSPQLQAELKFQTSSDSCQNRSRFFTQPAERKDSKLQEHKTTHCAYS